MNGAPGREYYGRDHRYYDRDDRYYDRDDRWDHDRWHGRGHAYGHYRDHDRDDRGGVIMTTSAAETVNMAEGSFVN